MDILIKPSRLKGSISVIPSKSYAHRALIAAALADAPCEINTGLFSEDIKATVSCISSLGAEVDVKADSLTVSPIKEKKDFALLDCNESGTTARLLLPVASVTAKKAELTGRGRLPERPMDELVEVLKKHGVNVSSDKLPITVENPPTPGSFEIRGNVSSQYISGLLYALPLLSQDSEILLTTPLESAAYVDMTLEIMRLFNIACEKTADGFKVRSGKYISPGKICVEADWSNAAFFVAANKLGADIKIENLNPSSIQGDRKISDILDDTEIDASQIPDLVPILAVLAAGRNKDTRIYNAERLRIKESDRLNSVCTVLNAVGGKVCETKDGLIIHGSGSLKGGCADSFNDHRIVMSLAVASLISEEPIIIKNAQAVNKSYPLFFEEFKKLGGNINVL